MGTKKKTGPLTAFELDKIARVKMVAAAMAIFFISRTRFLKSAYSLSTTVNIDSLGGWIVITGYAVFAISGFVLGWLFLNQESESRKRHALVVFNNNIFVLFLSAVLIFVKSLTSGAFSTFQTVDGIAHLFLIGAAFWALPEEGKFTVKAPNGKMYTFKDQAAANAFKKKAGIS